VSPAWAWLSRNETISISGYNTDWDDSTTVDFGPGITVDEVVVASPTSIVARITVDESANLGAHDVVVTGGGEALTAGAVFDVRAGIDAQVLRGDAAQGSFNVVAFGLDDPAHTLAGGALTDPTGGGFVHTLGGAGIELAPALGVAEGVLYAPQSAIVHFWTDPVAPASAPISLETTDLLGGSLVSTGLLPIAPRTPVALTEGTSVYVEYGDEPLATHLFKYTNDSGSGQLLSVGVGPGSGGEAMVFRYTGNSGRMRDSYFDTPQYLEVGVRDGESLYMMAVNTAGETGFLFEVGVWELGDAEFFASAETNDDACENAQDTEFQVEDGIDGFVIDEGVFDPTRNPGALVADSDWYRFTVVDDSSLWCAPRGNHDAVGVTVFPANDCTTPAGDTLAPGDYVMRVSAGRLFTLRGSDRYSVVCGNGAF
jgi:hypothetical protein